MAMTSFNSQECNHVWHCLSKFLVDKWNGRSGKNLTVSAKHAFFMALKDMKSDRKWNYLANIFWMKTDTFDRMVTTYLDLTWEYLYDEFEFECDGMWSTKNISEFKKAITKF